MTFYVGQKVVCILPCAGWCDEMLQPEVGAIYTVRATAPCPRSGRPHLLLREIVNVILDTELDGVGEPYYAAHFFRPVTNISIFTEILDRVNGDKPRVREEV